MGNEDESNKGHSNDTCNDGEDQFINSDGILRSTADIGEVEDLYLASFNQSLTLILTASQNPLYKKRDNQTMR